jgi:hypothetical protein
MAVTVHQQPNAYCPAHSPMIFVATSTQIASVNFTYTVRITDVITSTVQDYPHEQRPVTGECVFDARDFVKNFIKNYIPNNSYGFKRCTDAIRQITVNIGETYGTTPTYYTGSNITFIVWNGGLSWLEYPSYSSSSYLYKASTTNYKYLTSNVQSSGNYSPDAVTYSGKSHFIYVLSSENNDVELFRINTYNSAGTLLGQYDILNPYAPGTTYTDKLVCIDVGHKAMSAMTSPADYSVIFGSAPIITDSVAYYDIIDGYTMPPITARKTIQRLYIGCEAKHDVYTLHFQDKPGNFLTMNFPKFSEIVTKNSRTAYRQQPFTLSSNTWTYSTFTPHEKIYNTSEEQSFKITTDWMSETEASVFSHIIHSSVVYLDMGSTIGLIPVIVDTNSMIRPKKWNQPKMRAIQIDIRYTFKEVWQND